MVCDQQGTAVVHVAECDCCVWDMCKCVVKGYFLCCVMFPGETFIPDRAQTTQVQPAEPVSCWGSS